MLNTMEALPVEILTIILDYVCMCSASILPAVLTCTLWSTRIKKKYCIKNSANIAARKGYISLVVWYNDLHRRLGLLNYDVLLGHAAMGGHPVCMEKLHEWAVEVGDKIYYEYIIYDIENEIDYLVCDNCMDDGQLACIKKLKEWIIDRNCARAPAPAIHAVIEYERGRPADV